MTAKTIMVMAFAATLILISFTMTSNAIVDLVFDEPGTYAIKTNAGNFTCVTLDGDLCGVGTSKAKFQLLVTEVDETLGISIGVARGIVEIESQEKILLKNQGPLSFIYNSEDNELTTTGAFAHSDGLKFQYDAVGNVIEKNGKTKIKYDAFTLTDQDTGNVISVEGLMGTLSVVTEDDPDRKFKVKFNGPATCNGSSGEDCGIAKVKGGMILEFGAVQPGTSKTYLQGKANINLNIHQMGGLELKGDPGKHLFKFNREEMIMSGPLSASNGSTWEFEMNISNIDLEGKTGDCSSTLTSPEGTMIAQPLTECGLSFTGDFEIPDR